MRPTLSVSRVFCPSLLQNPRKSPPVNGLQLCSELWGSAMTMEALLFLGAMCLLHGQYSCLPASWKASGQRPCLHIFNLHYIKIKSLILSRNWVNVLSRFLSKWMKPFVTEHSLRCCQEATLLDKEITQLYKTQVCVLGTLKIRRVSKILRLIYLIEKN